MFEGASRDFELREKYFGKQTLFKIPGFTKTETSYFKKENTKHKQPATFKSLYCFFVSFVAMSYGTLLFFHILLSKIFCLTIFGRIKHKQR